MPCDGGVTSVRSLAGGLLGIGAEGGGADASKTGGGAGASGGGVGAASEA
jgi:hypothetical protein